MVESKRYAPTDLPHLNIELVFPGMTVQSYVSAGAEYLQNGDTTCKGVTRVIRGRVIKRLIQHAEDFITLQEEKFEMSATSVLASFSAETLSCTPSDGGCVGSQHTLVWQRPPTFDCPLQVVRTVIMHRQPGSTIYVSKDSMLAIEVKGEPTHIGTCPGEWQATQD